MNSWVYWKDECDYCAKNKKCQICRQTKDFRGALGTLERNTEKVYGTLKFNCDYFIIDQEKYNRDHEPECCCSNTCNKTKAKSVITLCGSTKFKDEFIETQKRLTLEGHVVLTVGLFGHSGDTEVYTKEGVKEMLDQMHLRKIDMSDEIYVINVGGYIGESTKNEIKYAIYNGKQVTFLVIDQDCQKFLSNTIADSNAAKIKLLS